MSFKIPDQPSNINFNVLRGVEQPTVGNRNFDAVRIHSMHSKLGTPSSGSEVKQSEVMKTINNFFKAISAPFSIVARGIKNAFENAVNGFIESRISAIDKKMKPITDEIDKIDETVRNCQAQWNALFGRASGNEEITNTMKEIDKEQDRLFSYKNELIELYKKDAKLPNDLKGTIDADVVRINTILEQNKKQYNL